jgi:AcrR family transcriptional regulator
MSPTTGIRELKKHRTHAAIVRAGMDLFAERGFDATTIADIADAAEIAPRTFFGYFASKEDLVFHDADELLRSLTERLRRREPGEDALAAMRAWILEYYGRRHAGEEHRRQSLIRDTPALAIRERAMTARFGDVLAEAIADDLGVDAAGLRPQLAGAAAVGALDAVGRWADTASSSGHLAEAASLVDEAIAFLRGGLDALRAT